MCEPLARQVQAFDAHATSAEPTVRVPSLPEHEQVGWWCRRQGLRWRRGRRRWRRLWRPRKRWCRRRRPVVSASSSSLPNTCAADSFISAQLNWPAAVVRACPAAPLHRDRAACRFGHSSLRDLRVLKEGRLAAGCSVAGRYVASSMPAGSTSPAMEVNKKSMLTRRASSLVAKAGRAPAAKLGVKREEPWKRAAGAP